MSCADQKIILRLQRSFPQDGGSLVDKRVVGDVFARLFGILLL